MQLRGLLGALQQTSNFASVWKTLQKRKHDALPDQHVLRSARPYVAAALADHAANQLQQPTLIITAGVERAYNVVEQLPVWLPDTSILRFAEPNAVFYERAPWTVQTIRARLDVLSALCPPPGAPDRVGKPPVIVTSALALMQKTLPPREFKQGSRILKKGAQADPDRLMRQWLTVGYQPQSIVSEPGTFNRRGGIVDVFPINSPRPIRIEFWGDEIDSLRTFDPATQRSAELIDNVVIAPAREVLPKMTRRIAESLVDWFGSLPNIDDDPASPIADSGDLMSESAFPTMEYYLPYAYSSPASLLDYLPKDALLIVDDWDALRDSIADYENQAIGIRDEKVEAGLLPADMPIPYLTWDELQDDAGAWSPVHLGGVIDGNEDQPDQLVDSEYQDGDQDDSDTIGSLFKPAARHAGQLKALLDDLSTLRKQNAIPLIVSNQAQRLAELWREASPANVVHPVSQLDSMPDALQFVEGGLAEGWRFRDGKTDLHLLTDAEIFGWRRPEPRRRMQPRAVTPESYFADLAEGDFVVHVEYGIARFGGLVKRMIDNAEREYLLLHFAGSDTLYVPIQQADRLSRYVGTDGDEPPLSKLGTGEWSHAKETAKKAAQEVAAELLDLYARRAAVKGYQFGPDTPWQAELEASFPYIETEDQVRVLAEVKADMESATPMDRLVCGDVGFGKTEIALRAAFKAVMEGKQVAILVPTTVLAQQHFNTFTQRMAAFPVKIEMLSRFRNPKEQRAIIEGAKSGDIDILIGTHRIIQTDVQFKDLGLLVIDEEQRFGVTHKERLKKMRTEVDVLTLTATPIPRTLYMSLTGVRDVSTLNTPPEARLPVITHVGAFDDKMLRQAILRELDRDGQVYYVHNRVHSIDVIARKIREAVPEASVIIGHGQMESDELERVMSEFAAGNYDVLLCTTIIESGLDIANANTIVIDDADTFGLAQLYQLRGRVGRGTNRAYAYLFHTRESRLTADARARLETIAEQTELGAGMSIAMRDLEIRGAGDLLGARQSGYIASVGFHLYTQLLAQAVGQIRGTGETNTDILLKKTTGATGKEVVSTPLTIDLPMPGFIPVDFIPEMALRLQLYRRIADMTDVKQVDEMQAELTDRFGALPPEVEGLLYLMRVKILAQRADVTGIGSNDQQISIRAPHLGKIDRNALQRFLGNGAKVSRMGIWLSKEYEDWADRLLLILDRLDDGLREFYISEPA